MKIIVSQNAGACYGVTRSLELALQASKSGVHVATLGELIHNPLVVNDLKDNYGISSVNSVAEAKANHIEKLIIRSHGVPLEVLDEANESGLDVVDATCPFVRNVQSTASLLAGLYPAVVIIGRAGHPEIESVSSVVRANGSKCFVGETIEELDKFLQELLDLNDLIGVVSQTTQSLEVFDNMVKYLLEKGVKIEVENTICAATRKRQSSASDLAKKVDAMIVIGGHNSSNTNHLAELCQESCPKVFHIESEEELKCIEFSGIKKLGITAGASTPKSQIDNVISLIQNPSSLS